VLEFDQQVDIFNPDTSLVLAAGRVEVSVNGGDWQVVAPVGGYPTFFGGTHPEWLGQPVFSGRLEGANFHRVRIPLHEYTGLIRIRFRFHSEVAVLLGPSWHIDNVSITSATTPVLVQGAAARVEGSDVRISWELGDPLPSRLQWRRGPRFEDALPVGEGWLPTSARSLLDRGGTALLPARYWLEVQDRSGNLDSWGPLVVEAPRTPLRWRVRQNPARGVHVFDLTGPPPPGASLEVYDVRGRLVREVPAVAGEALTWDGRDGMGQGASPGVYFARLRGTPLPPVRLVRLP
jgi:hypothetical protein